MKQLLLIATVLCFLSTHVFGQIPQYASAPSSITPDIDNHRDKNLYFAATLIKLIKRTPLAELPAALNPLGITTIASDDGKVRCYSWDTKRMDKTYPDRYMHLIEYPLASGQSRFIYTKQFSHRWDMYSLLDKWEKEPTTINKIERLRTGVYLVDTETDTEHKLYAIDIRNGMLKDAFPFSSDEGIYSEVMSVSKNKNVYTDNKDTFVLIGNILKVRETDEEWLDGYKYYYYRLSQFYPFDPATIHSMKVDAKDHEINRIYWTEQSNRYIIKSIETGSKATIRIDLSDSTLTSSTDSIIYKVKIANMKDYEEEEIIPYEFEIYMVPFNSLCYAQNIKPSEFEQIPEYISDELNIGFVWGPEAGFNQELVRYTAIALQPDLPKEAYHTIRWAISIDDDNEIQFLDPLIHKGPQVELCLKDEWIGKVITVMPFVDREKPNKSISAKIQVEAYY